ncbi:MAG: hypothetical protein OXK79_12750, partial [Chloroflexota bacterium]|nr:hypothetical protein [Chloroflexota bacterium]
LLDLLDALVNDRGKVAAAEALGVNFRTMVACHESRHVSRRMRRALEEYRDKHVDGADEQDDEARDIAEKVAALEQRVEALEEAHGDLVETVEAQARQLAELGRRVEGRDEEERERGKPDGVGDDDGQRWERQPPRRYHGLLDAGVVTLEEQPDEGHAFGPAATLVKEWRGLRSGVETSGGRVDRAKAAVRRWELEIAMLRDYGMTLPPETESLDASRREDHLRWRRQALQAAQMELSKAKWLRRVLTLGLRWT